MCDNIAHLPTPTLTYINKLFTNKIKESKHTTKLTITLKFVILVYIHTLTIVRDPNNELKMKITIWNVNAKLITIPSLT